jgi:hypothetical protein
MGERIMTNEELDKFILDPCCGPKEMWIDKNHPNVIYGDKREVASWELSRFRGWSIKPDILMDFRDMPFPDNRFRLVVFDPPHKITKRPSGELLKKYYCLDGLTWRRDLKQGFDECWRVLQDYGVLIFKWAESSIMYQEILKVLGRKPLFHNPFYRTKDKNKRTYWATFMKLPSHLEPQQTLI